MTDLQKSLSNGTLNVFDVNGEEVNDGRKLTHYLVDAETGEVSRSVYEGSRIISAEQTQAAIQHRQATDAQMSYGPFTFLFFTPLKDLGFDISMSGYTRLMYASTYLTYKGYLGDTVAGGKVHPFTRNKLKEIMKLSPTRFDEFWSEMLAAGIFKVDLANGDDDSRAVRAIFLDQSKFHRGSIETSVNQSYIRLNVEGVRSMYETCKTAKMHKTLAYIFKIIPWINREWNLACKNPDEKDYDSIRYLRLGEFAEMVGYSRDNAKRLAKDLNSVRFTWRNREQAAFIYMTNAPDRPDEWIIAINPRIYYAGQNFELVQIPDCGRTD